MESHPEDKAKKENLQVTSPSMHNSPMFITKYNNSTWAIKKTLAKHWGILYNDPKPKTYIPPRPKTGV